MFGFYLCHVLFISLCNFIVAEQRDVCERCLLTEKCSIFGYMNKEEQERWIAERSCVVKHQDEFGSLFGFAPVAKGDYVCCPDKNVWGLSPEEAQGSIENTFKQREIPINNYDNKNYYNDGSSDRNEGWNNFNAADFKSNYGNNQKQRRREDSWMSEGKNLDENEYDSADEYERSRGSHLRITPNKPITNQWGQINQYPNENHFSNTPFAGTNSPGRCTAIISFPPNPQSGCCGREASEADRITGGKATDIEQFPWTVLLKTTYDYGNRRKEFTCGGSMISSRYILTAAHCVYEDGAIVRGVTVTLAEYDKRTFPTDCVINRIEGRRCIENIVMHAEDVIIHPGYDDTRLQNDIALIRLNGNAPYTEFIRPICLPSIDVDNPKLSNLRLAVAGWGRNGPYVSDIKQSTVVNLVPQGECRRHYPHLTRRHLCAAGYTGEDTCKGDSGGPLMMIYEGKYFVIGVVSGKRADSPCGTAVPSLYTNVFHYLDWIRSHVQNG